MTPKLNGADLELLDRLTTYFNTEPDEQICAFFLERSGYNYDFADDLWYVSGNRTITPIEADCFLYLILEWNYGPPTRVRYFKPPSVRKKIEGDEISC